jgi:hypothetical protein
VILYYYKNRKDEGEHWKSEENVQNYLRPEFPSENGYHQLLDKYLKGSSSKQDCTKYFCTVGNKTSRFGAAHHLIYLVAIVVASLTKLSAGEAGLTTLIQTSP